MDSQFIERETVEVFGRFRNGFDRVMSLRRKRRQTCCEAGRYLNGFAVDESLASLDTAILLPSARKSRLPELMASRFIFCQVEGSKRE